MSWQTYVDTNLVGSGKIVKAAILGQKGGIWATSSGFTISTAEQEVIVEAFSKPDVIQASGINVGGVKYFTLTANERTIHGNKAGNGVVLVKTKQAVLVGAYAAPIQAGEAIPVVEGVADYLIELRY